MATATATATATAIGRLGLRLRYWAAVRRGGNRHPLDGLLPTGAPAHRPVETPEIGLYHPTFLYESLWDVGVAGLVIWADRRFRLGAGRAFALYLAAYTAGRAWIEALRIDPANRILGLRLNEWTSVAVFLGAVAYIWLRRGSGREETVQRVPVAAATDGGPAA